MDCSVCNPAIMYFPSLESTRNILVTAYAGLFILVLKSEKKNKKSTNGAIMFRVTLFS